MSRPDDGTYSNELFQTSIPSIVFFYIQTQVTIVLYTLVFQTGMFYIWTTTFIYDLRSK